MKMGSIDVIDEVEFVRKSGEDIPLWLLMHTAVDPAALNAVSSSSGDMELSELLL